MQELFPGLSCHVRWACMKQEEEYTKHYDDNCLIQSSSSTTNSEDTDYMLPPSPHMDTNPPSPIDYVTGKNILKDLPVNTSSIILKRDTLLKVSSVELSCMYLVIKAILLTIIAFYNSIRGCTNRRLTKTENNEIRKHMRLVKNREYASICRSRKRKYIAELEGENRRLKKRIILLENTIKYTS